MGTPTEEEVLAGIKRLILEEKRDILIKYMNPERYLDFLRSKFVMNEEDKEVIEYEKTRKRKASVMIDLLLSKGGNAYDMFVRAIQADRTQTDLVKMLHTEYEKRKNNYFALVRGQNSTTINIDERSLPKPMPPPTTPSENNQGERDHVPPPTVRTLLSTHPGRSNNPVLIDPQPSVCPDTTLAPPDSKETVYYRDHGAVPSPVRTENRIPSVVHEIANRETPSSTNHTTTCPNRPAADIETESMKEMKEQTNRHKLKFTSRSADHAELDPYHETNKKEEMFLREGEQHTESIHTESLVSTESTKTKELY